MLLAGISNPLRSAAETWAKFPQFDYMHMHSNNCFYALFWFLCLLISSKLVGVLWFRIRIKLGTWHCTSMQAGKAYILWFVWSGLGRQDKIYFSVSRVGNGAPLCNNLIRIRPNFCVWILQWIRVSKFESDKWVNAVNWRLLLDSSFVCGFGYPSRSYNL